MGGAAAGGPGLEAGPHARMRTRPYIFQTLSYIASHPLNRGRRAGAIGRFVRWQMGSRLLGQPCLLPMGGGGVLVARRGDSGATGNFYCGLHEYPDMLFVAHALRAGDLFLDIGSNVGSYTVLAARGRGARVVACEPVGTTFDRLRQNVGVNLVTDLVDARRVAVGEARGVVMMTTGLDTVNHVTTDAREGAAEQVEVTTLDDLAPAGEARLIKIDVEGFELNVLRGGQRVLGEPGLLGVVIELNGSGARYGVKDEEVDRELRRHGFVPCDYDPASRRVRRLETFSTSGNTIYVRDGAALADRLRESRPIDVFGRSV